MRILVVDDEPLIRRTLSRALAGHQVELAGSCAEARDLLAETRFDLVLSDMHLPDGIGTDLHAWIQGAKIEIGSFALMTGSSMATLANIHVLAKPFGRRDVAELIERARRDVGHPSAPK